jgi:hypothetical protein
LSFTDLRGCADARQNRGRDDPESTQYGSVVSWWEYVLRVAKTDSPKVIATETGIDGPHVSKWKAGQVPTPRIVKAFAVGYKRPVLEAFVAAGFLTQAEAKVRPEAAPDYSQLTNDELLELVRTRMSEGSGEHADGSAATKNAGARRHLAVASGGATPEEAEEASRLAAEEKARQQEAIDEMNQKKRDKE